MHHYMNFPIRTIEDINEFTEATASFQGSLVEESYALRDDTGELYTVNRESFIQKLHQVQQDPETPAQEAWAEISFSGGVPRTMGCDLDRLTEQREAPAGQEAQLAEALPF